MPKSEGPGLGMKKVVCTKTGKIQWANPLRDKNNPRWRCTKCGEIHS